jgi:hypothetical protein
MPKTITEAINAQPVYFLGSEDRLTSVRVVPYEEIYRHSTSLRETPEQRLQRALYCTPGDVAATQ